MLLTGPMLVSLAKACGLWVMIGRMLTRSQDLQCLFSKFASRSLVRDGVASLQQTGYSGASALLPSAVRLFHGRSLLPELGHRNVNFETLPAHVQNKSEPPPAASEHEARHVLKEALPIIPLARRGAGTQLQRLF